MDQKVRKNLRGPYAVLFYTGGVMLLTKNRYIISGGVFLLLAGIIAAAAAISSRHDPVTVPEQTAIHFTLDQGLASDQSPPGDHFNATPSHPTVPDAPTSL